MATSSTDVYPAVRALLGDTNTFAVLYSDDALDQMINLAMTLTEFSFTYNSLGDPKVFSKDLTFCEKKLIVLHSVRHALLLQPERFEYRNPVAQAKRQRGSGTIQLIISWLDDQIAKCEADSNGNAVGKFAHAYETEYTVFEESCDRFIKAI